MLDLIFDNKQWRVINFYNNVRDSSSLDALLGLNIDATVPTLVIGDFNAHSREWSPADVSRSTDAGRIEVWAAVNLLTLANTPREITRRGANHEKDSVIDLAWYNEAAIQASTFTGLTVDWEGSLGSDHAMLHVTGRMKQPSMQDNEETDLSFVVDPEKSEDWIKSFKTKSQYFPFSSIPTETDDIPTLCCLRDRAAKGGDQIVLEVWASAGLSERSEQCLANRSVGPKWPDTVRNKSGLV